MLLADGKHPGRERKAAKLRRSASSENTFESVAHSWHELKSSKLNPKYHVQILTRLEQYVFPEIGALPISEIGIRDVARVVEKIGKRGIIETAHRMKQVIGQVFRYAAHNQGIKAAFVFYGGGPTDDAAVRRIAAPVYGFYGGNDARVNATIPRSEELMKAAGKSYEPVTYEGAGHGFMRGGEAPDARPGDKKGRDDAGQRWKELLKKL